MKVQLYDSASEYSAAYLRGLLADVRKLVRPMLAPKQKNALRTRDANMPIRVRVQSRGTAGYFTMGVISLPANPSLYDFMLLAYGQARTRANIVRGAVYAGYEAPISAHTTPLQKKAPKAAKKTNLPSLAQDIEKIDARITQLRGRVRRTEGLLKRYATLIAKAQKKKKRLERQLEQEDPSTLSKRAYAARRRAKRESAKASSADR